MVRMMAMSMIVFILFFCAVGRGGDDQETVAPMVCDLEVEGQVVKFEIDTGSPYTIMSNDTLTKLGGSQKLGKSKETIKSFTGHCARVLGVLNTSVKHKNKQANASILVTEHKHNLVGRDLIDRFGLVTVNLVRGVDDGQLGPILAKHPGLFKEGVGKIEGVHVDGDKAPIVFKPRSLPYAMRSKVEEELQRLQEEDVIEPVTISDWATPIVPVLKSSGQVRICGDYKVTANNVFHLEQYPIPTLDDLMAKLGKGSVFHKLDLSHAYLHIELHPDSRKYVTINTHKGMFTYKRLPFGVSSAAAEFQRVMETLLQGVPCTVVYFGDILVTGDTEMDSYKHLGEVLD